jgi:DNA integrity scanning protein DisA with diadenylate cyclase activity
MPAGFSGARAELAQLHTSARAAAEAAGERWADLAPDVVRLVSQAMVRRFLAAMVAAHHGGAVIVLPPETAEDAVRGAGPLRLKYAFRDGEPRRRYRRLILGLMRALARAGGAAGLSTVDRGAYSFLRDEEIASMRDAIFEMSQLIAALSEVDGAVVMTKRFELLGFGAEIVGDLPDVQRVAHALDLEGEERVLEPVLADGTRHRSAYRLCSRIPEALALIVSQDGGVRFVAVHRGEVTFWDHAIEMLDG